MSDITHQACAIVVTYHPDLTALLKLLGQLNKETDFIIVDNGSPEIDELADSPNNQLRIYDRRGLLVFTQDNYTDQFNGISNVDGLVFDRDAGLPEGVYFYVVRLLDLGTEYQGFLYLRR